jgi:hypothetical protein
VIETWAFSYGFTDYFDSIAFARTLQTYTMAVRQRARQVEPARSCRNFGSVNGHRSVAHKHNGILYLDGDANGNCISTVVERALEILNLHSTF